MKSYRNSVPGRATSKCKGPEAGKGLVYSWKSSGQGGGVEPMLKGLMLLVRSLVFIRSALTITVRFMWVNHRI